MVEIAGVFEEGSGSLDPVEG
jgi:hypothetical protein